MCLSDFQAFKKYKQISKLRAAYTSEKSLKAIRWNVGMSLLDFMQGLQYIPNGGVSETTVLQNLINQGSLTRPLFTLNLASYPSSRALPNTPIPGGIITLGGVDTALANSGRDYSWQAPRH